MSAPDSTRRRAACARSLSPYAPQNRRLDGVLARWSRGEIEADLYGDGGAVRAVEKRVAELLGKPAAVFMPSGTMAQQIALRVHADQRGSRTVAFHPLCHIECNEERAYEHLHELDGRLVGESHRLVYLSDLEQVSEPLAALVLELPQRMIGAALPSWEDLVAQTRWARNHGAAVHLDGARLWEAQPFYGRPHAEIAALFDTVYVSFYKGLAGIGGCVLAGSIEVIEQARLWRTRHGGLLFGMWPYAAEAMHRLEVEVPSMARYWAQAKSLGSELAESPGIDLLPDPPQTPIFNAVIDRPNAALSVARDRIAEEEDVWLFDRMWPCDDPDRSRVEVTIGRQLDGFAAGEVTALFARLRLAAD